MWKLQFIDKQYNVIIKHFSVFKAVTMFLTEHKDDCLEAKIEKIGIKDNG